MNRVMPIHIRAVNIILEWEKGHPYIFSFLISLGLFFYFLLNTPSLAPGNEGILSSEEIQFIDIDQIQARAPRRVVKKQLSTVKGDTAFNETVEKASGSSDYADAVDISFYPAITPPRPAGRLKKLYPKLARDMNIEAVINVELLILSDGIVKFVNIIGIRLSKALPDKMKAELSKLFAKDAVAILKGARFTPPIVKGKNVPIKMEMPLQFKLN